MSRGGRLLTLASALAVALLILLAISAVVGRPILSYAKSGSMEPTLATFDGFLVNPFAGEVQVGDLIVYRSVSRGGEPAVHRVVGGDEAFGWYTKGDANEKEDQFRGEPPVTRDRILGKVVTDRSGEPYTIPYLGIPATSLRVEMAKLENQVGGRAALQAMVFGVLTFLFLLPALDKKRDPPNPRSRGSRFLNRSLRRVFPRGVLGKHLAAGLLVVLLASSAWASVTAKTDLSMQMVVVENPDAADGVRAAAPGDALPRQIELSSLLLMPTLAVLEPGTERVGTPTPAVRIGLFEDAAVDVEQVAGSASGLQEDRLTVWLYPAFLPEDWMLVLHERLPGSPFLVFGGLLSLAGYAWYLSLNMSNVPVGRWLGFEEDWV